MVLFGPLATLKKRDHSGGVIIHQVFFVLMPVNYYPFINKIITTLQLRDRIDRVDSTDSSVAFPHPFITVAREPGSGGSPIAQSVAKKLNFEFVDEQIIENIATSARKRKAIIKAVDEKHRGAIADMVHATLNTEYVNDLKYTTELVKVIISYANKGNVVILGRGANFILPFAHGLHVNITAPYAVRVQRAMDYEGHTRQKARQVIANVDKERREFVKQYLNHNIDKKNAYDITLNTTYFAVDQARDVIIDIFTKKFSAVRRYKAMLKS